MGIKSALYYSRLQEEIQPKPQEKWGVEMKTSIPWRRLDQKGKSGTKKIQKKVLTVPVQPLQPKKKTDIIKATSVFFAALLQSRAGPRERPRL